MNTSSPPILRNEDSQKLLENDGYAVVPYLLPDEIEELKTFFYAAHPVLPDGMYASSHAGDFELRKSMSEKVMVVCARALQNTFQNVKALGSTFMAKSKGENGTLNPHQDWNIVDERKFSSYNVWIPLLDVDDANGTILVQPRSHRLLENIRGLNIPSSFANVNDQVWKTLVPVNMRAGEALVYDHRLLHASGINTTATPRLVIVYGVIPAGAEMRYYYGKGDNIEIYGCTPDFFFTRNIMAGPADLPLLEVIKNNNPVLSPPKPVMNENKPKGLWARLSELWA